MKNRWKKLAAVAVGCVMASTMAFGFVGCGDDPNPGPGPDGGDDETTTYVPKQGTYRTYTSTMPSNWNELTYQDNSDTAIMNYISSSFYVNDYMFDEAKGGKFKADGSLNKEAIIYDSYDVKYSAATKLEDVTDEVDAKWGYTAKQKTDGGYAYKITLRQDLKWDDGTAIDASDFVYSMKEQLNPDFKHYRANSYYDQVSLINARDYLYKNDSVTYESVATQGYDSLDEALEAGVELYFDGWSLWGMNGAQKVAEFDFEANTFTIDENAPTMDQWVSAKAQDFYMDGAIADYFDEDGNLDLEAMAADQVTLEDFIVSGETLFAYIRAAYGTMIEPSGQLGSYVGVKVVNNHTDVTFEDVGIYAESKFELVVCLNKPLQLLNDDGSLNWQAAYYMSSLPLVKEDLFESCKKEPMAGSTLWTTNYNSSQETTASWGPYKLTQFQGGKSYTLERNEYWFGYNMEDYKNQYNVTKIECEKVTGSDTAWMKFLKGELDAVGLDVTRAADYKNSKYASFEPAIATYGILLSGDLASLNESGRNNSILAVSSFRKAFALALNREDYCATLSVASQPCYGLLGSPYYSDISKNEVYRDTDQAKEALLRAYGYTESNGLWSNGANVSNMPLDAAYETLGGNNLTLAKQELAKAIAEVKADPEKYNCDVTQQMEFTVSVSVNNENTVRQVNYIQKIFNDLTNGTELEGKIKVTLKDNGTKWATDFQDGKVDMIPSAGFGNAPYNVGYMIGAHIDPDSSFFQTWDTESETITFKMVDGEFEGAGAEYTMTAMNLYRCLNGNAKRADRYQFNWGAGAIPESARLEVMAVIEEWILTHYYFIPAMDGYSATVNGAKFSDFGEEYNTFMGFGGMRYAEVNYTDSEWSAYVTAQGGNLETEYKKTN